MMITERSKRVIPFRPHDAKRGRRGLLLPRPDRVAERRPDRARRAGRLQLRLLRERLRRPADRRPVDHRALLDDPHGQPRDVRPTRRSSTRAGPSGPSRSAPTAGSGWASASSRARRSGTGASSAPGASSWPASSSRTRVAVGNPARAIKRPLMRVLFLQQQPCMRALKYAVALRAARPEAPARLRLPGQDAERVVRLGRRALRALVGPRPGAAHGSAAAGEEFRPDLVHSHNLPGLADRDRARALRRPRAGRPRRPRPPEPQADAVRARLPGAARAARARAARGRGVLGAGDRLGRAPGGDPARYRLTAPTLAFPNYALRRDLPPVLPPGRAPERPPSAPRLPGDALDERRPLRPARDLRRDRRRRASRSTSIRRAPVPA